MGEKNEIALWLYPQSVLDQYNGYNSFIDSQNHGVHSLKFQV